MRDAPAGNRSTRAALLAALAALSLYLLLGQSTFYENDGHFLLVRHLQRADVTVPPHSRHFLMEPLLWLFSIPMERLLGISPYRTAVVFSSVGTALGVLFTCLAGFRLGLGTPRAVLSALLFATLPGVLLFATVVEFHGPFLAAAGLALFLTATWCREQKVLAAVLVGSSTALAAGMHATGQLLPLALVSFFLADRRREGSPTPRPVLQAGIALLVHYTLLGLTVWILRSVDALPKAPVTAERSALHFLPGYPALSGYLAGRDPRVFLEQMPATIWLEWFKPLLLASVLWIPILFRPGSRPSALVFLGALLLYLLVTNAMLGGHITPHGEFGAYLLPMAMLAALLAARCLPWPVLGAAALVSLGTGWLLWPPRPAPSAYRAIIDGIGEIAGERAPHLWTEDLDELGALLVHRPGWRHLMVHDFDGHSPEILSGRLPELAEMLRASTARGDVHLLTPSASRHLAGSESGRVLLAFLESAFRLEPRSFGSFQARVILPR